MGSTATLVILPPTRDGDAPAVSPVTDLLGLPMVRRNVLSAGRAGIGKVVIVTEADDVRRALEGTPALLRTPGEFTPPEGRAIFLAGGTLADSGWLKGLCEMTLAPGAVLLDHGAAAILEGTSAPDWNEADWRAGDMFRAISGGADAAALAPDPRGRFVVTSPDDLARAEDWLLSRLIKSGDSPLTRLVSRPVSLAISRRLAPTRITPNQVTITSILIGLASTPFFLSMDPVWQTLGAVLLLVHNIIDGCDGELARLKFQSSHRGMILDMWGDNLVHAVLFLCMGIGWSRSLDASWPLALAALAIAGTLWTAWLVYRQTMRWTTAGAAPQFSSVVQDGNTRLSRVMNGLGNRDFLYGIFVLSLFGKAQWLLPVVAIGSPLFCVGLLVLSRRARRTRGPGMVPEKPA